MSGNKKESMFAKLAAQQSKPAADETPPPDAAVVEQDTPPSPAPPAPAKPKKAPARKEVESVKGKRENPDYCQANAYVLKRIRRAVDRELLDIEGLDYSTLVEDLLRKWLKARGVSE